MALWLELEPPDRKVGGLSPAVLMLFPEKRVSVFLWTSLLISIGPDIGLHLNLFNCEIFGPRVFLNFRLKFLKCYLIQVE